jgi:hypothetical protein
MILWRGIGGFRGNLLEPGFFESFGLGGVMTRNMEWIVAGDIEPVLGWPRQLFLVASKTV